jgi:hypothetical protein
MNSKQLINKSVYGTIGYISSQDDLDLLEQYILYNLPVLKEYKQIIVATNYKSDDWHHHQKQRKANFKLWRKYFSDCVLIDSKINRGHNFGTADLDNLIFDYCKDNNIEWLCKSANDVLLSEEVFNIELEEKDFYYLNGISYEDLYLNNFDFDKIYNEHFYPQTNFYFINVSKCDYLNNKQYLNDTYYIIYTPNYNGKVWEYFKDWSCENFLRQCISRNNLSKQYLLTLEENKKLCSSIQMYQIGDPSHKNIFIKGICHFQYPNKEILTF